MTKRIRRHRDFDIVIQLKNDDFLHTPREDQRNWILNRIIREAGDELTVMAARAGHLVHGGQPQTLQDRSHSRLADQEIMEDWQIPVMRAMAQVVTDTHGDILEIGFGRGVASSIIQEYGVRSHAIVECNEHIAAGFEEWKPAFPGKDIRLIKGKWQQVTDQFGLYDGIFFHTYPLNEEDFAEQVAGSVTFAAHFFPTAARHLREQGRFTYLTNEADSLSRAHQRLLFEHFTSFTLRQVKDLKIPEDTRDAHWLNEMVIVQAIK